MKITKLFKNKLAITFRATYFDWIPLFSLCVVVGVAFRFLVFSFRFSGDLVACSEKLVSRRCCFVCRSGILGWRCPQLFWCLTRAPSALHRLLHRRSSSGFFSHWSKFFA